MFWQNDFIGWIFNAVKHDRIIMLVDFLSRICLNIPLGVEALFSPLFVANQLRFFLFVRSFVVFELS